MARRRSLDGQVIVITGGAQGIGAATARAVAKLGAHVAIGDLDGDKAAAVGKSLGTPSFTSKLDVTDAKAFTRFLDETEAHLGPINVLINNAGIMHVGDFLDETPLTTAKQVDLDFNSVLHGTREAVERMTPRNSGHIVNVASVAGKFGFAGAVSYCGAKFGVVGLSEALASELRRSKIDIDVSVVMPAIVRTDLTLGLKDHWLMKSSSPEDVADRIVKALQRPRFDVFVPRAMGVADKLSRVAPRKVVNFVMDKAKVNDVLIDGSKNAERAKYDKRLESDIANMQSAQ